MGGFLRRLDTVFRLGVKELYSLRQDPVLVFLILYTFTFAIYTVATGVKTEVRHASIAIADEDGSALSRRIRDAFLEPFFKPPVRIDVATIDSVMDSGQYAFVIDIPPKFEADATAGRAPTIQVNVDATAMTMAGNGALYVESIVSQELARYLGRGSGSADPPFRLAIRAKFNPNLESSWFSAIMQLVNNVTMMALILSGAAVIREREHGTIEHLLVTPVTPGEIMLAKIWANGVVVVLAVVASLHAVVRGVLGVEISGSIGLFALGTGFFLFAMTSLGVALATVARSMPQFGLLAIPFFVVMNMLSGGVTPLEAMPWALQMIMQAAPSTPYTSFAQAVLYRGAGIEIVWPQMATMAAVGAVFFAAALFRFRATMLTSR